MSSFGTEEGFAYYLRRSLSMMQAETPQVYERMCAEVAGHEIAVEVDGDRVVLVFPETGPQPRSAVDVRMSGTAILRLIDGETTLIESVLTDEVAVFARPADLAALYDGLMTFLAGLVRCPSAGDLLESFRRSRVGVR